MSTQQVNIINDLSTVTKVPLKIFSELLAKESLCIGSALHDAKTAKNDTVVLNIGLGTLSVELNTMQCKFMPGKELKAAIKRSLEDGVDPLLLELDQAVVDRLLTICKDVLENDTGR